MIPWDYDYSEPLRWRVLYTHSSTDADAPVFTFDYMGRAEGEAVADITSHKETTTTKTVSTTANAFGFTDWVSTESNEYIPTTDILLLTRLTLTDLGGAGANELEIWGVEYQYTVKMTSDDNLRHTTSYEAV